MKKISALILILCMILTLTACSAKPGQGTSEAQSEVSSVPSQQEETSGVSEEQKETRDTVVSTSAEASDEAVLNREESSAPEEQTGTRTLVVYFSCTNRTRGIAEQVIHILGVDSYEIVPEIPYTDEDRNYNDPSTRCTVEQNDDSARPVISGGVENMEDYDLIFLAYPIWWGQAPKIIYTFLESYDFSGKTIVPFCTSGSSRIGTSAENLHASVSDSVTWLDGTRFDANASQSEIEEWLGSLGLDIFEN